MGVTSLPDYANYDTSTNSFPSILKNNVTGSTANVDSYGHLADPSRLMNIGVTSQNTNSFWDGGIANGLKSFADSMTGDYWDLNNSKAVGVNGNTVGGKTDVNPNGTGKTGFTSGLGTFSSIAGGFSSLANIYLGFQHMDIMKDQNKIAKDQWKETKLEMNRIKGVRNRLNSEYSGKPIAT